MSKPPSLSQPILIQQLHHALPQTQCTKCGFQGCLPYAQAIAADQALPNQCPPGGQEGVQRLEQILKDAGRLASTPARQLNPDNGVERPRPLAVIDPERCIGCTLCIQACPTDAIVGAAKQLHGVLSDHCTGCDLCVPVCPVDCIDMVPVTTTTGWAAWSAAQAAHARARYERRLVRLEKLARARAAQLAQKSSADHSADKQQIIAAALARVRAQADSGTPANQTHTAPSQIIATAAAPKATNTALPTAPKTLPESSASNE